MDLFFPFDTSSLTHGLVKVHYSVSSCLKSFVVVVVRKGRVFELRPSCLLGRHSTAWVTLLTQERSHHFLASSDLWVRFFCLFFGSTGIWNKGLALARQTLYHFSHVHSPVWGLLSLIPSLILGCRTHSLWFQFFHIFEVCFISSCGLSYLCATGTWKCTYHSVGKSVL
jgi:hypothetical protein